TEEPAIPEVAVGSSEHQVIKTETSTSEADLCASLQACITSTSPSHALKSYRDNLTSAYSLEDTASIGKTSVVIRKPTGVDKPATGLAAIKVEGPIDVSSESIPPTSSDHEIPADTAEMKCNSENATQVIPSEISTPTAIEYFESTQPSPTPTDSSISTLGGGDKKKKKKKKQVCRKTTASSPEINTPLVHPASPSPTPNLPSISAELNRLKFTNPGKMNEEISFTWNHGNVTRGFRRQHTQTASTNSSVNGSETTDSASINWTQEEGYMARGHVKQMEMHDQLCRTNSFDPPLYDSRGLILATMEDRCDCMRLGCPGCFLPCRRCHKTKCGPLCRILRNFQYEQACLAIYTYTVVELVLVVAEVYL
ncbi:unnamed protein product, partial [Rodentolepis nana]|uniref:ARF7EP_C domain-containing protein n=1 Tax=Rodentolepis nana TaxID=102285 RepID=A0A0R3TRN3_RODNA